MTKRLSTTCGSPHRDILEAVRSADPDAAEAAMRAHMDAVVRRLKAPLD